MAYTRRHTSDIGSLSNFLLVTNTQVPIQLSL